MSNSIFQKHTIKEVHFDASLRDIIGYDNYGDVDTFVIQVNHYDERTGRTVSKVLRFPAAALD